MVCLSPAAAAGQGAGSGFVQVGGELAPADAVGAAGFGSAVALSGDGRTMVVGGPQDSGRVGAAWVDEWTGSAWSELGKLTPVAGGGTNVSFGSAVAISADGSTALVGGPGSGEVDVFARSGGGWSLQATLSPQGLVAPAPCTGCGPPGTSFGSSVALSADGDTALVGASTDTCENCGAVVAFVRSAGSWVQQGSPLRPTDETTSHPADRAVPIGGFGSSASLSANGDTGLIGDPNDGAGCITACAGPGAAWVFTRQGQAWSQLGGKITAPGGGFFFGTGGLAADGNSALIGGTPVVPLFTRSGSGWVAQSNAISRYVHFDEGAGLSGDGHTALLTGADCGGGVAGSFVDTGAGWAAEPQLVASGAQVGSGGVSDEALSGDGSIAVLDQSFANGGAGAVWTFAHRTAPFAVPTVTRVTPGALAPGGLGTQVAISGSGFSGTTSVTFGGIPAQSFCVVSPSEILATWSPSQPPPLGPAAVVVSTPAGSSPTPSVPNFYVTTGPSTPTRVRATAGDRAATVTFTGSRATGSPITYTVRANPSGRTVQTSRTRATITGLTPGKGYTFTVLASDPLGSSPRSKPSNTVTAAPAVGGMRISGIQTRAPRLRFTLHTGTGTRRVRSLTIALPPGLRFRTTRAGISVGAKHDLRLIRGRLRIVLEAPARELRVAIAPPALTASASLTRRAQRHAHARRPLALRFTITVAEPRGTTTTLRASASFR